MREAIVSHGFLYHILIRAGQSIVLLCRDHRINDFSGIKTTLKPTSLARSEASINGSNTYRKEHILQAVPAAVTEY